MKTTTQSDKQGNEGARTFCLMDSKKRSFSQNNRSLYIQRIVMLEVSSMCPSSVSRGRGCSKNVGNVSLLPQANIEEQERSSLDNKRWMLKD